VEQRCDDRERTAGEQYSSFHAASTLEVKNADRIIADYMSPTRAGQKDLDLAALALIAVIALALAACTTAPGLEPTTPPPAPLAPPSVSPAPSRPGGYYKDDGPGEAPPAGFEAVPDAVPRLEPLNRFANRPYSVFGRDYVPATSLRPYRERGLASWYGRKFHNQKTSTGEIYDMYAMTAAHPTLPLPSYARVTSLATGRSVVVRVNDRGPFIPGRVVDVSYSAAETLGIVERGIVKVKLDVVH